MEEVRSCRADFLAACKFIRSYYINPDPDISCLTKLFSDTLKSEIVVQATRALGICSQKNSEKKNKANYLLEIRKLRSSPVKIEIIRLKMEETREGTSITMQLLKKIETERTRYIRETTETILFTLSNDRTIEKIRHVIRYDPSTDIEIEVDSEEPDSVNKIDRSLRFLKNYLLEPNEEKFISLFIAPKQVGIEYGGHFGRLSKIDRIVFQAFGRRPFEPEYDQTISYRSVDYAEENQEEEASEHDLRLNFTLIDSEKIRVDAHRFESKQTGPLTP